MTAPDRQLVLHLTGAGKDYPKVDKAGARLKLVFDLLRGRSGASVFRALENVSLDLSAGDSVGIIGENGAGKSTLLKIIAGVIAPSHGAVEIKGRVSALLELGSGFHPEYTGLENIDLAAALIGLTAKETAVKRNEIIAFADIGQHIDQPIKQYSSGMIVRLGFAVATALMPDLLITDEVLSVGDESFQKKCSSWMVSYLATGGALLFCSHSMYHVQKLCRTAMWLKDGRVECYGPASEVCSQYLAYHDRKSANMGRPMGTSDARAAAAAGYYAIKSVSMTPRDNVHQHANLTVSGEVYSPDGRVPVVLVGIVRTDGTPVYGVSTDMDAAPPVAVSEDLYVFEICFSQLPLLPGKYFIRTHVLDPEGVRMFDTVENILEVTGETRETGLAHIRHYWGVKPAPKAT
jgi:ABC-type polysaccharide/polyol phosphate transport system ATPase subunit